MGPEVSSQEIGSRNWRRQIDASTNIAHAIKAYGAAMAASGRLIAFRVEHSGTRRPTAVIKTRLRPIGRRRDIVIQVTPRRVQGQSLRTNGVNSIGGRR